MREPDEQGSGVRAWRLPGDHWRGTAANAMVDEWLVHHPGGHPFWSHWVMSVIHLRPVEGTKPPHLDFPEATHEFVCWSVDPEQPDPDPDDTKSPEFIAWPHLEPLDWAIQTNLESDEDARDLAECMVKRLCLGGVSFDSDFAMFWGRTVAATAAHFRGEHDECGCDKPGGYIQ